MPSLEPSAVGSWKVVVPVLWQQTSDTPPSARMASLVPSLQPNQRRVVEAIMADRAAAAEGTAQELAEHVGVGRTTVISAAQSLCYDGLPQLLVAIVQVMALDLL